MPCLRCGNPIVENKDTGLCASCGASDRKAERLAIQEALKPPPKRIAPVSKKQATALRKYSGTGGTREEHLKEHPFCQVMLEGCLHDASGGVHHVAKRGKNLNENETFLTTCIHCHTIIETVMSAKERRQRGLLK